MSKKQTREMNTGRVAVDIAMPKAQPKKGVKLLSNGKVDVEYMRAKDNELVTGIFRYHELPGGVLSFPFKKYKGDPVDQYTLIDGQTYTIPLAVAKHLNTNLSYPNHEYIKEEPGVHKVQTFGSNMVMKVTSMTHRTSFQTLELIDDPELITKSDIAQVEIV